MLLLFIAFPVVFAVIVYSEADLPDDSCLNLGQPCRIVYWLGYRKLPNAHLIRTGFKISASKDTFLFKMMFS